MGSINGAIASAEPDGPAPSDSSHSTSDNDGADHNTPTPSAADDTPSASDDSPGSTGSDTDEGEDEKSTSLRDHEDTEPRSPVFAQSDDSDDPPPTDTSAPVADPVVEDPAPATGIGSVTTEVKTSSDTVTPAPSSIAEHTAALTVPLASAPSAPQAAPDPVPAPIPDAAPVQGPPEPATVLPAPTVASTTAPGLGAAVAYLLNTLVAAALDVVTAVIQLVADLRATLGIPWAGQAGSAAHVSSAFLPENSIVLVLERILSRTLSPMRGSSTLDNALAAGMGLRAALALTSALPAALALGSSRNPDSTLPAPVQGVATALAAMSLWALLSAALPGLGGLFAFMATGVRIGFRQARARMAVHTMELTRYVRAGPIGIVRSGSSVSVHAHTAPVGRTPGSPQLKLAA